MQRAERPALACLEFFACARRLWGCRDGGVESGAEEKTGRESKKDESSSGVDEESEPKRRMRKMMVKMGRAREALKS